MDRLKLALLCSFALAACESKPLDDAKASGGGSGLGGSGGAASGTESGGSEVSAGEAGEAGASGAAGSPSSGGFQGFDDGTTILDRVVMSSDEAAEYHQTATATIDFGTEPVKSAKLRIQLESPCYPFEGWKSQTTTAGHFWPDACDAFDRHFLISLDGDEGGLGTAGAPGIELTRAMTPFGGPLAIEQDITDVVNGLPGEHTLRIEIPTYGDAAGRVTGSKGAWIVSANVLLEPGAAPREVLAVVPLVFTQQTALASEALAFETPEGTTSARIEYRTTGHGQGQGSRPACIGPAEEFCKRTHVLTLDGEEALSFDPWRTDCGELCTLTQNTAGNGIQQYCLENPCGAIQSVQAPRANWCPGSVTEPELLEDAVLAQPGPHELSIAIDELGEGGNWLVSATFFAFK